MVHGIQKHHLIKNWLIKRKVGHVRPLVFLYANNDFFFFLIDCLYLLPNSIYLYIFRSSKTIFSKHLLIACWPIFYSKETHLLLPLWWNLIPKVWKWGSKLIVACRDYYKKRLLVISSIMHVLYELFIIITLDYVQRDT